METKLKASLSALWYWCKRRTRQRNHYHHFQENKL